MSDEERLLPQNIDAEMSVLGSLEIDPGCYESVSFLRADDFHREAHRLIFAAGADYHAQHGVWPDLITLCDELERRGKLEDVGGTSYVSSLSNHVPTSRGVVKYAQIVARCAVLRRLINAAGQIAGISYNQPDADAAVAAAEALIADVRDALPGGPQWDEPVPLPDAMPAVDQFDYYLLPDALRGWVEDVAERMQVPPDYLAVAAVVAAATVVGRQVCIYPKRHDDWSVVPNLWAAIVGPPSVMKSPALDEGLKPLNRLAADAAKAYDQALEDYEIQARLAEARKVARADKVKKAAKSGNEAAMEAAAREDVGEPTRPVKHRYLTNDATVEKLGELLLQNPNGLLQSRDELSGWLRTLEKQGHEPDRAFYLEAWNGNNPFNVDRITRGTLHIPALCLSLLGGIQPGPLASYVYDATNDSSAGNDGLLQRFQLLVWPDIAPTWRNVDRWPDKDAKNTAYRVYERLAALNPIQIGANVPEGEPNAIPFLRFDEDAQGIFDEWREKLELRLRSDEMSDALKAHMAKYRSLMPSLALLFHLMDGEGTSSGVDTESALRAMAWCDYLESHARRLYAHAENPGIERARALLQHIKAGDVKDGEAVRNLYRHHWSRLKTPDEMDDAVKTLESLGWVRLERQAGKPGRPSALVRLHPSVTFGTASPDVVAREGAVA